MDIGYVWDEMKYRRVKAEHGIRFDEVVALFEDENALYLPDPQTNPGREMVVARTPRGRILQTIITFDEDAPLVRIITAFDASEGWREKYVG